MFQETTVINLLFVKMKRKECYIWDFEFGVKIVEKYNLLRVYGPFGLFFLFFGTRSAKKSNQIIDIKRL